MFSEDACCTALSVGEINLVSVDGMVWPVNGLQRAEVSDARGTFYNTRNSDFNSFPRTFHGIIGTDRLSKQQ